MSPGPPNYERAGGPRAAGPSPAKGGNVAGIVTVLAQTLAEASEEYGELADLLQEMRGALHRSLRAPEEDLREQVRQTVRELEALLARDDGKPEPAAETVSEHAGRLSRAIRVALPELRDLLAQGRLAPSRAAEIHAELVSFLEAFLPELRAGLPQARD